MTTTNPKMSDRQLVLTALGSSPQAGAVAARLAARLRHGALESSRRTQQIQRLRIRSTAALVALAVVVAANVAAVRLLPTYAQAVAHAPLVSDLPRPVLQLAGLTEAQVTRVAVSATASGHTVTLLAASADSARTVVIIQVDGLDSPPVKSAAGYQLDATLTDQYGKAYQRIGGQGGDLWFSPLSGAATHGTAALTLRVQSLDMWPAIAPDAAFRPPSSGSKQVRGDWVVGTTVTRRAGVPVALPSTKTVAGVTYTVTSIRISGTEVTIDWKVTGDPRAAALYRAVKKNGWSSVLGPQPGGPNTADSFLDAGIVNADGTAAPSVPGNSDNGAYVLTSERLVEGDVQGVLPGPGDYLLRIGQQPTVEFGFKVP